MPILRDGYHNTRFGPQWTAADHDVIFIGIIACFVVLYVGFLILLPSFKMNKSTLYFYLLLTFDLWLGWVIIDCNWAYEWQTATVDTETFYAPYDPRKIDATLGLHMGLRGFNITLLGNPKLQFGQIIDYNEQFLWSEERGEHGPWQQGRFGYGPYAGSVAQKFREWQFRGYPQIITELAEYFTLDGEDIRWYRWYRVAGWYSHIALWTALPLWALSNALFIMKPSTGALWLVFTGSCMELTVMTYGIIVEHNNKTPFMVPYPGGLLKLEFGWSFYLVLFTGVLAILLGIGMYVFLMYHPDIDINLLTDPYQTSLDEKPEPAVAHDDEKVPPHRRALSVYGKHTLKKRPAPGPQPIPSTSSNRLSAEVMMANAKLAETKIDAPKVMVQSAPSMSMSSEPAVMAANKNDVEMLPMSRMLSTSSRSQLYQIDELELDRVSQTAGNDTDTMLK